MNVHGIITMILTIQASRDPKDQQECKKPASQCEKSSGNLSTIEQLLASQNRKLIQIKGDGNCLFRALSLVVYGSEMYYSKIRELLVNFVAMLTSLECMLPGELHLRIICYTCSIAELGAPRWSYMLQHLCLVESFMSTPPCHLDFSTQRWTMAQAIRWNWPCGIMPLIRNSLWCSSRLWRTAVFYTTRSKRMLAFFSTDPWTH